jgi:hypothetical protein
MNKHSEKGETEQQEGTTGQLVSGELDPKLEKACRPKKLIIFELPKDVRQS